MACIDFGEPAYGRNTPKRLGPDSGCRQSNAIRIKKGRYHKDTDPSKTPKTLLTNLYTGAKTDFYFPKAQGFAKALKMNRLLIESLGENKNPSFDAPLHLPEGRISFTPKLRLIRFR